MKKYVVLPMRIAIAVSFSALLCGSCQKNSANPGPSATSASHPVRIFLTDAPILNFDQVLIEIQKLEIKAEDSGEDRSERGDEQGSDSRDGQGQTSGGWITLDIKPGIYDLLHLRNGLDTLMSSGSFSALRTLRKIRLTLGPDNSVVANGIATPLTLAGNNIVVIKLSDDFLDDNPSAIDISLDFDAGNSIRLHGSRLELDPRIRPFRKERTGGIEGRIAPVDAMAVVMAIGASDTATAKPDAEGEFKIDGLRQGSYMLLVHATAGNFVDTTLQNITIAGKEDVQIGTITLHP